MISGSPPTSGSWAATPALATTTSSPPRRLDRGVHGGLDLASRSVTSHARQGASPHRAATSASSSGSRPGEGDARAALVEPFGEGGADAAGGAGDEHAAAFE